MAAGTYYFGWIKSWTNSIAAHFRHRRQRWTRTWISNNAYTTARVMAAMAPIRPRVLQLNIILIAAFLNRLTSNFLRW